MIFTKSSKCLQNWSMLANLKPNLDDVYHHPDPTSFLKSQMIIIHHPFFCGLHLRSEKTWLMINHHDHPWSSMIYPTVPHGAPLFHYHFFTDHRRQGSIPWYQEFPQVPRSIRAIDPGVGESSPVWSPVWWTGWFGADFLESSGQDPMNLMDEFCESMLKPYIGIWSSNMVCWKISFRYPRS